MTSLMCILKRKHITESRKFFRIWNLHQLVDSTTQNRGMFDAANLTVQLQDLYYMLSTFDLANLFASHSTIIDYFN